MSTTRGMRNEPSSARNWASLPLVFTEWGRANVDSVEARPFLSVTRMCHSPVVFDVSLKGMPASLAPPSTRFRKRKSPRITWSVTVSPSSSGLKTFTASVAPPSSEMWRTWTVPSRR